MRENRALFSRCWISFPVFFSLEVSCEHCRSRERQTETELFIIPSVSGRLSETFRSLFRYQEMEKFPYFSEPPKNPFFSAWIPIPWSPYTVWRNRIRTISLCIFSDVLVYLGVLKTQKSKLQCDSASKRMLFSNYAALWLQEYSRKCYFLME